LPWSAALLLLAAMFSCNVMSNAISIPHDNQVSVAYRPFFSGSPPPTAAELCREWMSALADPTAVALLATVDRRPAGSVLIRADRQAYGGELHALHVLPEQWGHGIGSALHDGAIDLLAGGWL
jgi:GNAT superfamily N-acetyltransferase